MRRHLHRLLLLVGVQVVARASQLHLFERPVRGPRSKIRLGHPPALRRGCLLRRSGVGLGPLRQVLTESRVSFPIALRKSSLLPPGSSLLPKCIVRVLLLHLLLSLPSKRRTKTSIIPSSTSRMRCIMRRLSGLPQRGSQERHSPSLKIHQVGRLRSHKVHRVGATPKCKIRTPNLL